MEMAVCIAWALRASVLSEALVVRCALLLCGSMLVAVMVWCTGVGFCRIPVGSSKKVEGENLTRWSDRKCEQQHCHQWS